VAYFANNDPFYYPLVKLLADTGMRPSEAGALRWANVDLRALKITIARSRNCGEDFPRPKTKKSRRTIDITPETAAVLKASHTYAAGNERVFVNKVGDALNTNYWAGEYWRPALAALGIRWRKFYALRHTHITEFVQAGYEFLSIARYHGTSIAMIEDNYCGALKMVKAAEMRKAG
jgi:integrase